MIQHKENRKSKSLLTLGTHLAVHVAWVNDHLTPSPPSQRSAIDRDELTTLTPLPTPSSDVSSNIYAVDSLGLTLAGVLKSERREVSDSSPHLSRQSLQSPHSQNAMIPRVANLPFHPSNPSLFGRWGRGTHTSEARGMSEVSEVGEVGEVSDVSVALRPGEVLRVDLRYPLIVSTDLSLTAQKTSSQIINCMSEVSEGGGPVHQWPFFFGMGEEAVER
eukprot:GHVN01048360.1.p1 GENE.GHVN01048360.1~~GHVN01048360.1.p1  ORF type:complete len:227 (-),score=79.69 GHVN01048360.1:552-1208(-)